MTFDIFTHPMSSLSIYDTFLFKKNLKNKSPAKRVRAIQRKRKEKSYHNPLSTVFCSFVWKLTKFQLYFTCLRHIVIIRFVGFLLSFFLLHLLFFIIFCFHLLFSSSVFFIFFFFFNNLLSLVLKW
jgi:hypothetical protein